MSVLKLAGDPRVLAAEAELDAALAALAEYERQSRVIREQLRDRAHECGEKLRKTYDTVEAEQRGRAGKLPAWMVST